MKFVKDLLKPKPIRKIVLAFAIVLFPLIIVHILFSVPAAEPLFSAHWTAGDLIAYIAGTEAFLGTLVLGLISIKQSDDATKISRKMLLIEESQHQPMFDFRGGGGTTTKKSCLSRVDKYGTR